MPVKIEITGETAGQAIAEVAALAGGFSAPAMSEVSSDVTRQDDTKAWLMLGREVTPSPEPVKRGRGRPKSAPVEPAPATEPTPPADVAVTQAQQEIDAQDAADEKADTDAQRNPAKPLTIDDVRAAVGEYVAKWTMAAAKWDLQVIWRETTGGKADRMSQLVDVDQPTLQAVIAATKKATAAGERPADGIAAQKAAEAKAA